MEIKTLPLDHLGLVSGVFDQLDIADCQRRSKTVQLWRYKTVHLQIRLLLDQTTSPNYRE